jgi:hypothetical protein
MSRTFTLLHVLLIGSVVPAATPSGLASSAGAFRVQRADITREAAAGTPTLVAPGDRIESGAAILKVETLGGLSLLAAPATDFQLRDGGTAVLSRGALAYSGPDAPADQPRELLTVANLAVAKQGPAEPAPEPRLQFAAKVNETGDEVIIYSNGAGLLTVRDTTLDQQVAVSNGLEALRLVRDRLGKWQAIDRLVQESELEGEGFGEQSGEEGVLGGLEYFFGGGSAGAAGAAVAVVGGLGLVALGTTELAVSQDRRNDSTPTKPRNSGDPGNRSSVTTVPIPVE